MQKPKEFQEWLEANTQREDPVLSLPRLRPQVFGLGADGIRIPKVIEVSTSCCNRVDYDCFFNHSLTITANDTKSHDTIGIANGADVVKMLVNNQADVTAAAMPKIWETTNFPIT